MTSLKICIKHKIPSKIKTMYFNGMKGNLVFLYNSLKSNGILPMGKVQLILKLQISFQVVLSQALVNNNVVVVRGEKMYSSIIGNINSRAAYRSLLRRKDGWPHFYS